MRAKASAALEALNLLCTVSGIRGLLARAAVPLEMPFDDDGLWRISADGTYRWRGDVSSDQMTGAFYGYALAFDLTASDAERKVIARNVADMTDYLHTKNHSGLYSSRRRAVPHPIPAKPCRSIAVKNNGQHGCTTLTNWVSAERTTAWNLRVSIT